MNILLATSEAAPFAKTGGLGDVCRSLPLELAKLGHRPQLILPAFRQIHRVGLPIRSTGIRFQLPVGGKTVPGHFLESQLPESNVPVYFVEQDDYFDRDQLYRSGGKDYIDNCERFAFFCRAVLEAIRLLDLKTELIHANDWATGLIPAYLKIEYRSSPQYEHIATLFTIHNLAYQGNFWHWDMLLTGLDWKYFNWRQMEFFGKLSLMKTGLVFSDALSTVSPRYGKEIQSAPLGCGLEGVLRQRRDVLSGILNGVDYGEWDPATDGNLTATYDVHTVHQQKPLCKHALQKELNLPTTGRVPLVALIGRLAQQKGWDLIIPIIQEFVRASPIQWVVLGTGDPIYHQQLELLAKQYPQQVAVRLEFSDRLAHIIEAGADIFLMPSQYEPCGLNQLYSLKYGTVPVVRTTGGLADSIVDTTSATLATGTANGFRFEEYSKLSLSETLRRACDAYQKSDIWKPLIEIGMQQDWSWARSSREYSQLYQKTLAQHRQTVVA